jgi:tetratricopeptide (TPR) repeat protein
MKLIAHRGNLNGPNTKLENSPEYILNALNKSFDCEIDIRYVNKKLFLGHDTPDYEIDINFLLENSEKFWIHCKNFDAIHGLGLVALQLKNYTVALEYINQAITERPDYFRPYSNQGLIQVDLEDLHP